MNLAFYVPLLNVGGAERVIIDLLNSIINKKGNNYTLFLITDTRKSMLINELDVKIKLIHISSDYRFLFRLFYLRRIVKKNKINVISSHLTHTNIYSCFLKLFLNVRVVLTEHSIVSRYFSNNEIKNTFIKLLIFFLFRFSEKIICVSNSTKNDLIKNFGINADKCKVVYNPLDFECIFMKSLHKIDETFLAKLDNTKYFISIGRLEKEKNHKELIYNIKSFLLSHNLKLVIVGGGSQKFELEKIIQKEGLNNHVVLTGYCPNPYPLLKNSIAYIHSSLFEGFGLTLIEALYFNKDILVFRNEVIEEVIGDIPNAYIYENKDVFHELIQKIFDTPGNYEFPLVLKEKFDLEKISNTYLTILS